MQKASLILNSTANIAPSLPPCTLDYISFCWEATIYQIYEKQEIRQLDMFLAVNIDHKI